MTSHSIQQDKGTEKSTISDKRQTLINLSQQAREMREENPEFEDWTINQILLFQYSDGADIEFNTLWQWRKKGYKVKKGSKAFLVWGKKKTVSQDDSPEENATEYKFFPICYLFSENQVEEA